MAEVTDVAKTVGVIPLHFDVPSHALSLSTFIETASRTEEVIGALNQSLFEGQLVYNIYVLPPEEGSFKSRLAFYLIAGVGFVSWFAESDMGKAFIEGLTNHPPEYYFRESGKYLQKKAVELTAPSLKAGELAGEELSDKRDGTAAIIVETARSFMQRDRSELRKIGVEEQSFRGAFEARNEFYRACAADREIRALGFNEDPIFPIERSDFARLQVALLPREEMLDMVPWNVEIVRLNVTSPNWDRHDRKRTWKGKDANNKERTFFVEDEYFWGLVGNRQVNPLIVDVMKVQWAFATDKRRTPRVLKVLEYNDQVFGAPLDDAALRALLGLFNANNNSQQEFFVE